MEGRGGEWKGVEKEWVEGRREAGGGVGGGPL